MIKANRRFHRMLTDGVDVEIISERKLVEDSVISILETTAAGDRTGSSFQTLTGKSNGFMASTSKRVTMSKTNRKRLHSSIDYCSPGKYECVEPQ